MKITVGQALLILIEKNLSDTALQKLYLNGASSEEDLQVLNAYLKNPLLRGFEITADYDAINDDPTRRYFESHLAQLTLSKQLSNIPLARVEELYHDFQNLLPKNYIAQSRRYLNDVLMGNVHTSKFEYQTKARDFIKMLSSCNEISDPIKKIESLQRLSKRLLKEMGNNLADNYIESHYKRFITALCVTVNEISNVMRENGNISNEDFAIYIRNSQKHEQVFNHIFKKFEKDPCYENTGREFSQIIASISREKNIITQLTEKIQAALGEEDYMTKIEALLKGDLPLLENDTVKNHLQPALNKIQQLKAFPIERNLAIISIVNELQMAVDNLKKMYVLARCGYVSTVVAVLEPKSLPYDVYNTGYFTKEQRGRSIKGDQVSTRSQNYGLLKSSMPTSQDDISHKKKAFHFMKPSEQSHFEADKAWVIDNFSRMVHPFSNSISGTMLIQARTMLALILKGKNYSREETFEYFKLFIATMLFSTGGHSFHEYIQPLNIPQISEALGNQTAITVEQLFYHNNSLAFNQAFRETIEYNRNYLLRKQLNEEIQRMPISLKRLALRAPIRPTFATQNPLAVRTSIPKVVKRPSTEPVNQEDSLKKARTRVHPDNENDLPNERVEAVVQQTGKHKQDQKENFVEANHKRAKSESPGLVLPKKRQ